MFVEKVRRVRVVREVRVIDLAISLRFSTQELLGLILNVNNFDGYGSEVWEILAGCGWLWVVVAGCGWLWLVVGGCGWFWLVLGGCGWLWVVVAGFGSFLVLVCTNKSSGLGPRGNIALADLLLCDQVT